MKFTIRLVGAIWLSVLIVIGGFAFLQIREERERLVDDLKRRAVLVGEGLKEAIEPQVARGSTVGVERILKKFGRPTRGIAVYDRFAGLMVATPEVAQLLPPSLPEVTDAVATNAVSQGFRVVVPDRRTCTRRRSRRTSGRWARWRCSSTPSTCRPRSGTSGGATRSGSSRWHS